MRELSDVNIFNLIVTYVYCCTVYYLTVFKLTFSEKSLTLSSYDHDLFHSYHLFTINGAKIFAELVDLKN